MAVIDPEEERRRLQEFYSQQMDGELEKIAATGYELTEIAREVLKQELARRQLTPAFNEAAPEIPGMIEPPKAGDPPPDSPAAVDDPEDGYFELRSLVTVRTFRDLPEALVAKATLESSGIDAFLVDDNTIRMDWFWSNGLGGVKVMVDREHLQAADEILNQPTPESLDVPGVGEYRQPRCPRCESLDVTFKELNKPVAYVSAYFNLPIPLTRRAWRCHSCNCEWEDDQSPEIA